MCNKYGYYSIMCDNNNLYDEFIDHDDNYLDLECVNLNSDQVKSILNYLQNRPEIEGLILEYCELGHESIIYISEFLKNNSSINYLELASNCINIEGIKHLSKGLKKNNFIEYL